MKQFCFKIILNLTNSHIADSIHAHYTTDESEIIVVFFKATAQEQVGCWDQYKSVDQKKRIKATEALIIPSELLDRCERKHSLMDEISTKGANVLFRNTDSIWVQHLVSQRNIAC